MNSNPQNLELARRYLDGTATAGETRALEKLLRTDAAFRRQFLHYTNVDAALSTGRLSAAPAIQPAQVAYHPAWFGWFQWRPLMAAAGLVIGLFSASVVFGFGVQRGLGKRTRIEVFAPGFENPQMPLASGFPGGPGRWSGDAAYVVGAENGVLAKEGKFMLRLEPMSKGVPRIYQVLDLQSLPSDEGAESLEIEVSASFATAGAEAPVRYVIRAFAGTEAPENLDAAWFDRREESIASATKGLDVMPGTKGWQTSSVKIQVPRAARSLVLFFGARTPDKAARTIPHYLDDVRVSLITPPPLP